MTITLLLIVAGYFAVGFLFAIAFVIKGCSAIDPTAAGGSFGFRLLILPGATALWPILLVKWLGSGRRANQGAGS